MNIGTILLDATHGARAAAAHAAGLGHGHAAAHAHAHGCAHAHHHPFLFGLGVLLLGFFVIGAIARGLMRRRCGHGRFGGHRGPLHFIFRRLDTSASQEKVIREAIESVRGQAAQFREEGHALRAGMGRVFDADTFDVGAAVELFSGAEGKFPGFRECVALALEKVHAVLTPSQRKELSALIASGPRFGFGGRRRRW